MPQLTFRSPLQMPLGDSAAVEAGVLVRSIVDVERPGIIGIDMDGIEGMLGIVGSDGGWRYALIQGVHLDGDPLAVDGVGVMSAP